MSVIPRCDKNIPVLSRKDTFLSGNLTSLGDYIGVGTPPEGWNNGVLCSKLCYSCPERCERPVYTLGGVRVLDIPDIPGFIPAFHAERGLFTPPENNNKPRPRAAGRCTFSSETPFCAP